MRYYTSIIGLILCVLFAGCGTMTTQQQATIERYFDCPKEEARAQIEKAAIDHGYIVVSPTTFRMVLQKKKDPILGLITTSDQMALGYQFTLTLRSDATAAGTLVTTAPVFMMLKPFTKDQYVEHFRKAGSDEYNDVVAVFEKALARVRFKNINARAETKTP